MIPGSTHSCFPSGQQQGLSIYGVSEDVVSSNIHPAATTNSAAQSNPGNFLYDLSVLKDKVHQVQSLATMFISSDFSHDQPPQSAAMAVASMGTLIQEIIVTASSLMFTCQQFSLGVGGTPSASAINNNHSTNNTSSHQNHHQQQQENHRLKAVADGGGNHQDLQFGEVDGGRGFYSSSEGLDWYGNSYVNENTATGTSNHNEAERRDLSVHHQGGENNERMGKISPNSYDIVELDAADLLAKYTHYCQVCGKGFKRDANLRMHMRAHGDEYKSSAALSNPLKNSGLAAADGGKGEEDGSPKLPRKYSCPQEGCRWNKKHAKFQPLKSMICVKNHYKRSHCPKMYVCKRCNRKQFSVLSDLRTHEKHCGDLKWQCSCGTTFSRKDKLLGHVALFVGHTPAVTSLVKMGKVHQNPIR